MELLEVAPDGAVHRAEAVASAGCVDLLLDGAHNAAGAAALALSLDDLAPSLARGRATLLFGALRDKQLERMVEALRRSALVRDGRVLVASFHPELTEDTRVHEMFLNAVREAMSVRA